MAHRDGVAAVDRALSLLEAFDDGSPVLALAELSRRTGLIKSTVLRLAASLERGAFLQRQADGAYRLGPALFRLGARYQSHFQLADHVMPVLKRLAEETGESASIYVREGDRRICLHRVHSMQHQLLHFLREGTEFPYTTGGSGRVIAAFTDEDGDPDVRRRMVARSVEGRTILQTAAVAAPVFGPDGAFLGALSLAGPSVRFTEEALPRLEAAVLRAASDVTRSLGGPVARYRLPDAS